MAIKLNNTDKEIIGIVEYAKELYLNILDYSAIKKY